jgi:hypothetical protein
MKGKEEPHLKKSPGFLVSRLADFLLTIG